MKKLFVDGHLLDGFYQGSQVALLEIYKNILIINKDFEIYMGVHNIENVSNKLNEFNIPINFIKYKSRTKYVRLSIEIPLIIAKYSIDIAHFTYYLPLFIRKKVDYIVNIYDILFEDYPEYFKVLYKTVNHVFFKRSARKSTKIITCSFYSKERISEIYKIKKEKIRVIPLAVNDSFKEILSVNSSRRYIKDKFGISNFVLFVSRLEDRKNHRLLLDVFEELELVENKEMQLVFIGNNINNIIKKKECKRIIDKYKYNIILLEQISEYDLIRFYNSCKIFIFPSFCEGFGLPPLEAVSQNCPVICSNATSMADFKKLKMFQFNPKCKEELKSIIKTILNQKNYLFLEDIDNEVLKTYNWMNISKEYYSYFKSL